jgi:hypothetical protein
VNPHVAAAIAAIGQDAWQPIRYPRAVWDDQLDCWVSDAEVAEIRYAAFTRKKGQEITARLIVRRIRDLNKQAAVGQDELFPVWRYHAIFAPRLGRPPRQRKPGADRSQVRQPLRSRRTQIRQLWRLIMASAGPGTAQLHPVAAPGMLAGSRVDLTRTSSSQRGDSARYSRLVGDSP